MVRCCAVLSCTSKKDDQDRSVSFHRFPTKERDAKNWMHFLNEANAGYSWKARKHMLICSKHFRECCLYETLQTNRICYGHSPSLVDGKVIANPNSKCRQLPSDSTITQFKRSHLQTVSDARREFLVRKLNSFPVPKVVIGKPPLVQLPTVSSVGQRSCSSTKVHELEEGTSKRLSNSIAYDYKMSTKNEKEDPLTVMNDEVEITPITLDFARHNHPPGKRKSSLISSGIQITSRNDSYKNKIKQLKLENQTLRKSLSEIEKTVEEMENEIVSLKSASVNLEKRHLELRHTLKKTMCEVRLQKLKPHQHHSRRSQSIQEKVSSFVDIVDISNE
ncbi:unnamed protein product [Orchesella dallaii]|uniref:THAP-type domain-containing protein n=1 Tax=Orchesella dallaii TaxID=48710 RepID=A0ABP1Q501_9HEXA